MKSERDSHVLVRFCKIKNCEKGEGGRSKTDDLARKGKWRGRGGEKGAKRGRITREYYLIFVGGGGGGGGHGGRGGVGEKAWEKGRKTWAETLAREENRFAHPCVLWRKPFLVEDFGIEMARILLFLRNQNEMVIGYFETRSYLLLLLFFFFIIRLSFTTTTASYGCT